MAYFDGFDDEDQGQIDAENKRRFLSALVSAPRQPVLGQPNQPGSREYTLRVGATSQPNLPTPKPGLTPQPPDLGSPSFPTSPILGGATKPQPMRPDVMPRREDFQAKPELSGWKKYLGLGLATLAGQNAGPLAEQILHGQRD